MAKRTNRTFICSVLFLDIVEYSNKSVEEQIKLKEHFNAILSETIKDIAVNDRIILDTGDGAAIGFLGDPEDALFVAMELRDAAQDNQQGPSTPLPIRMGINLGPVKLITDINKQLNLIGDGINVAQRVMSFSQPGQLLVSRSYFEVISCLSQEYAKLFEYQGLHADKHIREHGIYAVGHYTPTDDSGAGLRGKRSLAVEAIKASQGIHTGPTTTPVSGRNGAVFSLGDVFLRPNRKWLYAAVPLALILIIVGIFFLQRPGNSQKQEGLATAPQPTATADEAPAKTAATVAKEAEKPALIQFRITPWGEVYINGKKRGVSPPLTSLKLKPGTYNIEIKNSSFPAYSQEVDVKTGSNIRIRHKFQ